LLQVLKTAPWTGVEEPGTHAETRDAQIMAEHLEVKIDSIEPNRRYVVHIEVIEWLCASIRSQGQQEPILVVRSGRGYRIVDGEKRWRACKKLKHRTIKVVVEASPYEKE
jgi:ParB family chromosome partitioning protein